MLLKGGETGMSGSFRGYSENNIDEKGRIVVPQKFRDGLGSQFVLTRGGDGNLLLCPEQVFRRMEQKARRMPVNSKMRFFLLSGCEDAVVDKQGRIVIPGHLRKHADLVKECVYSGSIDFVQLWSRPRYNEYLESIDTKEVSAGFNDFVLDEIYEDETDEL